MSVSHVLARGHCQVAYETAVSRILTHDPAAAIDEDKDGVPIAILWHCEYSFGDHGCRKWSACQNLL